jgi:protein CpxP
MKFITTILAAIAFVPMIAMAQDGAAPADKSPAGTAAPVETRITELHQKLKITTAQEELWKAVAQEMRDGGKSFNESIREREGKAKTMTAIDDLNSYADMAQKHADGMKKFVTVFSPLYNAMPDAQKKNADQIFREHKDTKRGGKA